MASISRYKAGWRVVVCVNRVRRSKTFRTRQEALRWASLAEIELREQRDPSSRTVKDLFDRYLAEVTPLKAGARHETHRLLAIIRDYPWLANSRLSDLRAADLSAWRDARLREVKPDTVIRTLNTMNHAFRLAREEWEWMTNNPFKGMGRPKAGAPRDRLVSAKEVRMICKMLDYRPGKSPVSKQQEVALAFMVSLRSAMRAGEILNLGKKSANLDRRVIRLEKHKTRYITGRAREVPINRHTVRLLTPLANRERFFTVSSQSMDSMFRRAVKRCGIEGLRFHDARASALTRLAKKVDPLTLAKISGHKDLNMILNVYYRESAEDIAKTLG